MVTVSNGSYYYKDVHRWAKTSQHSVENSLYNLMSFGICFILRVSNERPRDTSTHA